jgi:hypothetical protein
MYGIKGRHRILRSVSQKKIPFGKKAPEAREGEEGSRATKQLSKGLFDFMKVGNKWFSSRYNEHPLTIMEEINQGVPNINFLDTSTTVKGDIEFKSGGTVSAFRFYDNDNSHYTGLKAHATTTGSVDYVFPDAKPTSTAKLLQSDTSGNLSWVSAASGGAIASFFLEDGDGTEVEITDSKEIKFIDSGGIDINWTDTTTGSDADPYDLTFTVVDWAASSAGTVHATNYTNTMGSGFTVSATTDTNATTITQGDDLMFTAGTGIACETTADGTVTISSNLEGTEVVSTGETGGTKFLREDSDNSCSWQDAPAVNTANIKTALNGDFSGDFVIGTQLDDKCTFAHDVEITSATNNTVSVVSSGTSGGSTRTSAVALSNNTKQWNLQINGGNTASSDNFSIRDKFRKWRSRWE